MVGYSRLENKSVEHILKKQCAPIDLRKGDSNYPLPLQYHRDDENKILTILTPIHQDFFEALTLFRQEPHDFSNYHLLAGVVGNGVTEKHIITAYVPPKGDIQFFDSKVSDPARFFANAPRFNFRQVVKGLWNALTKPGFNQTETQINNQPVVYSTLGTQSFFDGVSCGYHHAAQLLALRKIISSGGKVGVRELLNTLHNPVGDSSNALQDDSALKSLANLHFLAFLKKAWQDTYLRDKSETARQTLSIGQTIMEWPEKQGALRKAVYFLTLGFIFNPLVKALKLPELVVNGVSETFNFLKNRLIAWAPTHPAAQYLRTGLLLTTMALQGLFKGLYFAIRPLTSPITSLEEAWRIHPALGILSGLVSATAYAALIFFAAPVVAPALMATGPAMGQALAYPLTQLLGLIGVSVSAGILTLGAVILYAGKRILNKLVDSTQDKLEKAEAKKPEAVGEEWDASIPGGSNVQDAIDSTPLRNSSDVSSRPVESLKEKQPPMPHSDNTIGSSDLNFTI